MAYPSRSAAVYLRVSTDHQRNSLLNQSKALSDYARLHGYKISHRYVDEGKSGLTLSARPALQHLLADILDPNRKFNTVLVYNVSRWGRFQDLDEASHYEFLCRQAGIELRYCEEDFPNDGVPFNFVFKTIRRAMAAEFSRQLSDDIRAAKHESALLGGRAGGSIQYGLGKRVITPSGQPTKIPNLDPSKKKTLRVVHALGPPEQVDYVRQIFHYALRGKATAWIAHDLNNRGIKWLKNEQWTPCRVRNVLKNELFAGRLVSGRTTRKLGSRGRVPPSEWVLTEDVVPPVVSRKQFDKVQELICPPQRMSNNRLLKQLRNLLKQKGRLSSSIIQSAKSVPGIGAYYSRFGNLTRAYAMVGYKPSLGFLEWMRRGFELRDDVVANILKQSPGRLVMQNRREPSRCPTLILDQKIRITVRVCRQYTPRKTATWILNKNTTSQGEVCLLCLLDREGRKVAEFYVYPHFASPKDTSFVSGGAFLARGYKLKEIGTLPEAVYKFLSRATVV